MYAEDIKDDIKEELGELIEDLKQQRDELRVQMHLAGAEAKDFWEDVEKKWQRFESRSAQFRDEARDAGTDIAEAARLLGGEIREGYDRLRKLL